MEENTKPVEEQPEEVVEEEAEEAPEAEAPAEEEGESEELSSKLDLLLSEIKKLSKKVAKLEEAEEAPEAEAPAEEEGEEESGEEPEASELKAQKKSLSLPEVRELSGPTHALLGNQYSQAEMRLAKVLQENARE